MNVKWEKLSGQNLPTTAVLSMECHTAFSSKENNRGRDYEMFNSQGSVALYIIGIGPAVFDHVTAEKLIWIENGLAVESWFYWMQGRKV